MAAHDALEFVQFLDGDCVMSPDWLERACESMDADASRAVVVGRLEERRPDASIYNRMCALEWKSPEGDLVNFGMIGGIMFVRVLVFERLSGVFLPKISW